MNLMEDKAVSSLPRGQQAEKNSRRCRNPTYTSGTVASRGLVVSPVKGSVPVSTTKLGTKSLTDDPLGDI